MVDTNSGKWNSGFWNSGDRNSGFLNTIEPKVRIFDADTSMCFHEILDLIPDFFYWNNHEWIETEHMTAAEKEENPSHEATGGFLRVKRYKEAWREAWDKAEEDDKRKCLSLPNWDNAKFLEITGIDVEKELESVETIEFNGHRYKKSEFENAVKDLKPIS